MVTYCIFWAGIAFSLACVGLHQNWVVAAGLGLTAMAGALLRSRTVAQQPVAYAGVSLEQA